jgi:hypothetical protein
MAFEPRPGVVRSALGGAGTPLREDSPIAGRFALLEVQSEILALLDSAADATEFRAKLAAAGYQLTDTPRSALAWLLREPE